MSGGRRTGQQHGASNITVGLGLHVRNYLLLHNKLRYENY